MTQTTFHFFQPIDNRCNDIHIWHKQLVWRHDCPFLGCIRNTYTCRRQRNGCTQVCYLCCMRNTYTCRKQHSRFSNEIAVYGIHIYVANNPSILESIICFAVYGIHIYVANNSSNQSVCATIIYVVSRVKKILWLRVYSHPDNIIHS